MTGNVLVLFGVEKYSKYKKSTMAFSSIASENILVKLAEKENV